MRYTKTDYPIGATWEAKSDRGMVGRICLYGRNEYFEVWYWSVRYSDGSGGKSDWYTSYRKCKEVIPLWNTDYSPIRFKRTK